MRIATAKCATCALTGMLVARPSFSQTFQGLGTARGGTGSSATGVEAGGAAVAGTGVTGEVGSYRAILWTPKGGMHDLGVVPDGSASYGQDVAAGGLAVTGYSTTSTGLDHAFHWTPAGGMADLGVLPGTTISYGFDINGDGSVVTGFCRTPEVHGPFMAFIWSELEGMQALGTLPGGSKSQAYSISNDGSVVVGYADNHAGNSRAFRWTAIDDMQALPSIPGEIVSAAFAVSPDGQAITGSVNVLGEDHTLFWTAAGGTQDLGMPPGASSSVGEGVCDGGWIVVGQYYSEATKSGGAMIWRPDIGMVDLHDYLASLGIDLADWHLGDARDISADGSTIIGWGIHEFAPGQMRGEGWIATIPLPCPADILPNGAVDIDDLFEVLRAWGDCPDCSADFFPPGGNEAVNIDEIFIVIEHWGGCP